MSQIGDGESATRVTMSHRVTVRSSFRVRTVPFMIQTVEVVCVYIQASRIVLSHQLRAYDAWLKSVPLPYFFFFFFFFLGKRFILCRQLCTAIYWNKQFGSRR